MEAKNIESLREQRNSLISEAKKLTDQATEAGSLTADQEQQIDKLLADADQLKNQISLTEKRERLGEIEGEQKSYARRSNPTFAIGKPKSQNVTDLDALSAWFRFGIGSLSHREHEAVEMYGVDLKNPVYQISRRDDVVDTTVGAKLRPTDFYGAIRDKIVTLGGVYPEAYKYPTSHGRDLLIPFGDDTSNTADKTAEKAPTTPKKPDFSDSVTLKAYKYTTEVQVSEEMLEDDATGGLANYITSRFARRFFAKVEPDLATGNGTTAPEGVLTGASAATTTETTLGTDLLIDMIHSVDPAFRQNCIFMGNDNTAAALEKMIDGNGRPLLENSTLGLADAGPVSRVRGYRYVLNNFMDTIGSGSSGTPAKPLVFGAIGTEYWVREVNGIQFQRLNELGARDGIIYFLAKWRLDGRYASNNDAVVYWSDAS